VTKGNLTREQKSRLVESINDETDALTAQNSARVAELAEQGLGVSPITMLAAQVEALIHWTAPSEYARARFDRDVQLEIAKALDEGNVEQAKEQMSAAQEKAEKQRAAMEAAAKGRRESGLYVPESAATPVAVIGADGSVEIAPEAEVSRPMPNVSVLRPPGN